MLCCSGLSGPQWLHRIQSCFVNGDGHSDVRRQQGEKATHARAGDWKGLRNTKEMMKKPATVSGEEMEMMVRREGTLQREWKSRFQYFSYFNGK